MAKLNFKLRRQVRKIVKKHFKIWTDYPNKIVFENRINQASNFSLYCEHLTVEDILECSKIVVDVWEGVNELSSGPILVGQHFRELNRPTEDGARFLKSVIALDGSSLHKYLLLTSGEYLLNEQLFDLLIQMAQIKKVAATDFAVLIKGRTLSEYISRLYLFPGVSDTTDLYNGDLADRWLYASTPELSLRLMAFVANASWTQTLDDFFKLDFLESISEVGNAIEFKYFTSVQNVMRSEYEDLANSLTYRELVALGVMLGGETSHCRLPEEFLKRRAKAMANNQYSLSPQRSDSVIRYFSDAEMDLAWNFAKEVDSLLVPYPSYRRTYNPALYAAIAEVASSKGHQRAIDVARELEHLQVGEELTLDAYEATVLLILEALNPEFSDYPFSWVAQMSPHAWVTNSHADDEELALVV